jgi:Holliday junction resolvasome RuvABC DNA-binding subunit
MKTRDGVMALISLGYKQAEARKIVERVVKGKDTGELSVEDIVRKALGGTAKE